ncbi:unnamed protein product [Gongylonema pulchrum]|uniref:Uncharacterized protein n=1 Tax=Gongylonema pulchrum TaxID=637853 RepID=A0A3P7PWS1_9BILA|nr:unnamed protein product [Gongylonema pulchrum]
MRDDQLVASVAGAVEQVNKLVSVRPVKSRYNGEIGDVVIGRILEVQQKRWKVDTNSRLHSTLLLSSVNLPGGELRRKSVEDELMMREYLKEGDLISSLLNSLQLAQGTLLKISPYLIKRRKSHFHTLPYGVSIIFGRNGYVWISPVATEEQSVTGGYVQNLEEFLFVVFICFNFSSFSQVVPMKIRTAIARVANCVIILAKHHIPLFDTSVVYAYDASMAHEVKDLLKAEIANSIAAETALELEKAVQEV